MVEKTKNELAISNERAAISAETLDPYAAAADDMGTDFLPILRMTKSGQWVSGPDHDPLADNVAAFAMGTFKLGYVCWVGGKVVDEVMVLVANNEPRPLFGELPDHSPFDSEGDGWVDTSSIQLRLLKTDDEFLYRPSSRGGLDALAGLARRYATRRQRQPDVVPIVRLESKSYQHAKYGEIFTPVLRVIDWGQEPELVGAGSTNPTGSGDIGANVLCDEIPY